ncbi:MAG: SCO family protein [Gemmatimonadetes bacterium]|nr:SCO family protein [Gemmatimonadota bacterium]
MSQAFRRTAFLTTTCLLLLAGCAIEGRRSWKPTELRGWIVDDPLPKADFTLESMNGGDFSFLKETEGFVTLLFFGYTYCPDICPLHMANISAVLRKLTPDVANQIKVVFVTTDPERDTPERMREWLGHFDRKFVGLRGTLDEVNAIQASIGLGAAFREEMPSGDYGMAHAAQVLAYTTDNRAHVMYAFGTRQEDWAHDLPMLVENGPPSHE